MIKILALLMISIVIGCKPNDTTEKTEKEDWWFWTASWNSEGNKIAVGGTQDSLRIFTNSKLKRNYRISGTITSLKWHPNNNIIAISTQGDNAKSMLKDIDNDKEIILDSINGSRAIGWNTKGDLLAVGGNDGFLSLYNNKGILLKKVNLEQRAVTGLDWHPEKNILITVGHHIVIYDFENDKKTEIIPRNVDVLMLCVEWHPSGKFFVTGDYGDTDLNYPALLQFWDEYGHKIKDIEHSKAEYRNLNWTKNGEVLATASDAIRLWTKDGKIIKEKKVEKLLWGIDWNNNDNQLVTTDEVGSVIIWDKELEKIKELEY